MSQLNSPKTLQDLVNFTDIYDLHKVAYYNTMRSRTYKTSTVLQLYYPFIKNYLHEYKVTKDQREKYKYRPDILSTDVYGTPMLDWFIMWANNRECPSKFTIKQTIALIPPDKIEEIFVTLSTKASKSLNNNWTENKVF